MTDKHTKENPLKKPVICVLYLRVSKDQDIDMQRNICLAYAKVNNIKVVGEFIDESKSGITLDRPGFKSLMASLKYNSFNSILVYKSDRLGRKLRDMWKVLDELKEKKMIPISATDNHVFKRLTESERFSSDILMRAAEFERGLARDRSMDGQKVAVSKGHRIGKPPFGYMVEDKKLVPNPDTFDTLKQILKDRRKGRNVYQLSKKHGIEYMTVRYIVNNKFYRTGKMEYHGEVYAEITPVMEIIKKELKK